MLLNLRVFIEGYYIGSNEMEPVLDNSLVTNNPIVCDSIIVELYESFTPYLRVASVKTLLNTNGTVTAIFPPSILNSTFYIAIRHRNATETWSKFPVLFDSSNKSFDFTTP